MQQIVPCLVLLVAAVPPSPAQQPTHGSAAYGPHARLQPVAFDSVEWSDGFLAERVRVSREISTPAMGKLMEQGSYKPFLANFEIAAGWREGDYHGAAWNDGDFYKWLEAAIAANEQHPNSDLAALVDRSIKAIAAAQRADGYLHTPVLVRQRNGDASAQPFGDRFAFEMYNMGHLMTTAALHHRLTGRTDLLDAAEKAAHFLDEAFKHPTPELARNSVCPAHYMGIVDLYRETGRPEYLDLARRWFAMRALVEQGGDDNQDRVPFTDQVEIAGHAVRANYLYCGAADLYAVTGDAELFRPLPKLWNNLASKKLYITGACGALYDGASPDGIAAQEQITRVHQSYGRNYQLPQTTAHNETCANIAGLMWSWRMGLLTGENKYADAVETALYNSVLAGVDLAGTKFFYANPLRVVDPLPTELRYPRTRQPFFVSFCCPPNLVRVVNQLGGYAYAATDDAVTVNLYGSNRATVRAGGGVLTLVQSTNYPWSGDIQLAVEKAPPSPVALRLRIPSWADAATAKLNGAPVTNVLTPGKYFELRRSWKSGDTIQLSLPLRTKLIEAHPLVEEVSGQVAMQRGPVVYCLESADLPAGTKIDQVSLPHDAIFTPDAATGLEKSFVALRTQAIVRDRGAWGERLYRERVPDSGRRLDVKLVPYFAWNNRSPGEMSVWLPVE